MERVSMVELPLDGELLKLLASDTRREILVRLRERRMTLSELAKVLGLGKATVSEHLRKLVDADLVRRHDDPDRMWVYHSLSARGLDLMEPRRVRFTFVWAAGLAALVVGVVLAALGLVLMGDTPGGAGPDAAAPPSGGSFRLEGHDGNGTYLLRNEADGSLVLARASGDEAPAALRDRVLLDDGRYFLVTGPGGAPLPTPSTGAGSGATATSSAPPSPSWTRPPATMTATPSPTAAPTTPSSAGSPTVTATAPPTATVTAAPTATATAPATTTATATIPPPSATRPPATTSPPVGHGAPTWSTATSAPGSAATRTTAPGSGDLYDATYRIDGWTFAANASWHPLTVQGPLAWAEGAAPASDPRQEADPDSGGAPAASRARAQEASPPVPLLLVVAVALGAAAVPRRR